MFLLAAGVVRRAAWIPVVWVAAACLAIAINGSRNLPQYFVQAAPALALAAGVAITVALPPFPRILRWAIVFLLAAGVWRVGDDPFPKLARNVWHDTEYVIGRIDRRTHLARYGGLREIDKYSALDNVDLGTYFAAHTRPDDTVLVFGFRRGAVYANRASASRFFWSRAVILDFNRGIRAGASPDCSPISSAPARRSWSCRSTTGRRTWRIRRRSFSRSRRSRAGCARAITT